MKYSRVQPSKINQTHLNLGQDEFLFTHTLQQLFIKRRMGKSVASCLQSLSPFHIHWKLTKKIRDFRGKKLNGVSTLHWVIPCRCKTFSDVHGATECLVLAVSLRPQSGDLILQVQESNHSVKVADGKKWSEWSRKERQKKKDAFC